MYNKSKIKSIKFDYAKIPNKIFRSNLNANMIAAYCLFVSLPEDFHPSIRFISSVLKISPTSVVKLIRELERRSIIELIERGNNHKPNKYALLAPKQWKLDIL